MFLRRIAPPENLLIDDEEIAGQLPLELQDV